jgi:tRNA(Ile)-lysidine synthase
MNLEREILAYIQREQLLSPGDRVVVGVSGGPDSLCLLHVLWTCQARLEIDLHIAHLNHQVRGTDADADARFVGELAAQWQLPSTIEACDVPSFAQKHRLAIEEAARRVRYRFLLRVARSVDAQRIAVAHNADDQSETVLMHWLRGAGLAGLRGMLPTVRMSDLRFVNRPQSGDEVWLIRPLLEVPRTEIEHYCQAHSLRPRFDRSNLDTTLHRNKLRHELLPYLEQAFKPRFREILRRSARVIRDDYDLLCKLRAQAWEETVHEASGKAVILDRAAWQRLHPSLQRATVRYAVQHLRRNLRDVNYQHVEAAVRVGRDMGVGAQATLPRDLLLTVGYRTIVVADRRYVPRPDFPALASKHLSLTVPGTTWMPGGGRVEIDFLPRSALPQNWARNPDPWLAFLDAKAIGTHLSLRRRRSGDRFCPLGLAGKHKLVSELLINAKVPAWWRDQVPLLVRPDDQILWVCGWRIDHRARVTKETSQVAMIQLHLTDKGKECKRTTSSR